MKLHEKHARIRNSIIKMRGLPDIVAVEAIDEDIAAEIQEIYSRSCDGHFEGGEYRSRGGDEVEIEGKIPPFFLD